MVHNLSQAKKYILLCIIYLHTVLLFSQSIEVCGTISSDTQWAIDTIKVTCDVTVDDNVTLTINPGVIVEFQGQYAMFVKGQLIAQGLDSEPIYFTINDTTGLHDIDEFDYLVMDKGWMGIWFDNSTGDMDDNDSSVIDYCTIEYVLNFSERAAIWAYKFSKLRVSNSKIQFNNTYRDGAGIYLDQSNSRIENNSIVHNKALTGGGGAIYSYMSNAFIFKNRIESNTAYFGGGIACYVTDSALIEQNEIIGNDSETGGGIYVGFESPVRMKRNLISRNIAESGGGIYLENCTLETLYIINNVITHNNASVSGGGVLCNICNINIINNTIANNIAGTQYGGGIFLVSSNTVAINNILWYNEAFIAGNQIAINAVEGQQNQQIIYSNVEGGIEDIGYIDYQSFEGTYSNNISIAPQFIDTASNNFDILRSSECVNKGSIDTSGLFIGFFDISGNERVQQNRIDIGAFESEGTSPRIHLSVDSLTLFSNAPFASVKQACCECYGVDNTKSGKSKKSMSQLRTGLAIPDDIMAYWKDKSIQLPRLKNGKISVDWRHYDNGIKDQGDCGSCWAIAATSLVEYFANANDEITKELSDTIKINLSAQKLISCVEPNIHFGKRISNNCDEGWYGDGLKYIHDFGVTDSLCYAYIQGNGDCNNACQVPQYQLKVKGFNYQGEWGETDSNTVSNLKQLLLNGPVIVSMWVPDDENSDFYSYSAGDGIYYYSGDSLHEGNASRHAVLAVGYDDKAKHFIFKNHWIRADGRPWGDNGFCYIHYNNVMGYMRFGGYACTISGVYLKRPSEFTISNKGNEDLSMNIKPSEQWLAVNPEQITIAPGSSESVHVMVKNWDDVNHPIDSATLHISSNDFYEPEMDFNIEVNKSHYFHTVCSGNKDSSMLVKVIDAKAFGDDLEPGDEIAVFDGENCVGTAIIQQKISPETPLCIEVCKDDPSTPLIDGYIADHEKKFKKRTKRTGKTISHTFPIYFAGAPEVFEPQGVHSLALLSEDVELMAVPQLEYSNDSCLISIPVSLNNYYNLDNLLFDIKIDNSQLSYSSLGFEGLKYEDANDNTMSHMNRLEIKYASEDLYKNIFDNTLNMSVKLNVLKEGKGQSSEISIDSLSFLDYFNNPVAYTVLQQKLKLGLPADRSECLSHIKTINESPQTVFLYPNPTIGTVYLNTADFSLNRFEIYNQFGYNVARGNISGPSVQLDCAFLPEGIYILKLMSNKNVYTKKLVIRK